MRTLTDVCYLLTLAVVLSAVGVLPARAAESMFERTDLFEAGKDGYALYRIRESL